MNEIGSFLLNGGHLLQESSKLEESNIKDLIAPIVFVLALSAGVSLSLRNSNELERAVQQNEAQIKTLLSNPDGKAEVLQYLQNIKMKSAHPDEIQKIIDRLLPINDPEQIEEVFRSFEYEYTAPKGNF